ALGAQSYVPSLFYFFSDPEHVQALQDYAKANREMVNEKEVAKGVDEIEVRAALKSRLLIELASLQNSATPH
ncbi:MAG TPA: hypothetical protein VGK48_10690, partial [Terriglobia bacterium]